MARTIGVAARGIRTPIIRQGDDLVRIVTDSLLAALEAENITVHDRDIVGVTEAVVARAQGNYASCDQIARDIRDKFGNETVGVIFPILSRNRFAVVLKGIARGARRIVLMLSYPSDEVGNHLLSLEQLEEKNINPSCTLLDEAGFRELFGKNVHPFTKVDYVQYYRDIITAEGCEAEIVFSNNAADILQYTPYVLCADVHSRQRSKRLLKNGGAKAVWGLDDILSASVCGSGYNAQYGLLGSNKATEETVKLFPRDAKDFTNKLAASLRNATGKNIEAMVYGDGAFKDPQGMIWELADPVVCPGHTDGLIGLPNEVKLKYIADNQLAGLSTDELNRAMTSYIANKDSVLMGSMESQGTTPRRFTDLLGSLCDLISGSGDKGTPVVFIQGYFDDYSDQ